jgi:hypothetical protein
MALALQHLDASPRFALAGLKTVDAGVNPSAHLGQRGAMPLEERGLQAPQVGVGEVNDNAGIGGTVDGALKFGYEKLDLHLLPSLMFIGWLQGWR